MARLHSASSGAGAWTLCLDREWRALVPVPHIQVVGCAIYASQALDVAIRRSTHKEHNAGNRDPLHIEWHKHSTQHPALAYGVAMVERAFVLVVNHDENEFLQPVSPDPPDARFCVEVVRGFGGSV